MMKPIFRFLLAACALIAVSAGCTPEQEPVALSLVPNPSSVTFGGRGVQGAALTNIRMPVPA